MELLSRGVISTKGSPASRYSKGFPAKSLDPRLERRWQTDSAKLYDDRREKLIETSHLSRDLSA